MRRWGLTILAMSADVHKKTSLLQSLLHTILPLIIAHVCHPVPVHRKDLISNLNLTVLRRAAFSHTHIPHTQSNTNINTLNMHYTQNKCWKLLKTPFIQIMTMSELNIIYFSLSYNTFCFMHILFHCYLGQLEAHQIQPRKISALYTVAAHVRWVADALWSCR